MSLWGGSDQFLHVTCSTLSAACWGWHRWASGRTWEQNHGGTAWTARSDAGISTTSAGELKVHLIESLCRGVCFAGSSVLWMQCAASVHSLPLGWKLLGSMSNYWRGKVALLKWILILSVFKSKLDLEQSKTKITKCPFLPLGCGPCFCCVGSCGLRIVTQMQLWIRGSSQICHLCTKQS